MASAAAPQEATLWVQKQLRLERIVEEARRRFAEKNGRP